MSSDEEQAEGSGSNNSLNLLGLELESRASSPKVDAAGMDSNGPPLDIIGSESTETTRPPPDGKLGAVGMDSNGPPLDIIGSESTETTRPPPDGKPPRAPTNVGTRIPKPEHDRGGSTGEYSALSALTFDGAAEGDLALRNRSVSWDFDAMNQPLEPSLAILAPSKSPQASFAPSDSSPVSSSFDEKQKLGLLRQTIVNPLETEAEAAILRVLDRQKKRDAADSGHILPHVPPEAESAFHQTEHAPERLASPHSSPRGKAKSGDEAKAKPGDEAKAKSGDEVSTNSGLAKPKPIHKRTQTLENTLFELGTQMERFHVDQGDARERAMTGDSHTRGRMFSIEVQVDPGQHTGDVLMNNAAILFGKPETKKNEHPSDAAEEARPLMDSGPTSSAHAGLNATDLHVDDNDETLPSVKSSGEVIVEANEASSNFDEPEEVDIEAGESQTSNRTSRMKKSGLHRAKKGAKGCFRRANNEVKQDLGYFCRFLRKRRGVKLFLKVVVVFVILPLVGISAILFYSGKPPGPRLNDKEDGASTSWLLLFLARQVVTFIISKATELFVIDFLSLQLRWIVRIFGSVFTLLLVQSKGLPFTIFSWGIFNLALNSGTNALAEHWLFWQPWIDMFNANNPDGSITNSHMNYLINGTVIATGFLIALKRMWFGLYLGKRSYLHYGDELARVVKNMLLVSEVANLANAIEIRGQKKISLPSSSYNYDKFRSADSFGPEDSVGERSNFDPNSLTTSNNTAKVIDETRIDRFTGMLSHSQLLKIQELLGYWEEPETLVDSATTASIESILQFRQMLAYMDQDYPFSIAFGPAENRESCVQSAQIVYQRLMKNTPGNMVLPFDTIGSLALSKDGEIDSERMKDLIRLFRPDRRGNLTMLNFVRSCDTVYKDMRLLRASISNSGQIDRAFETIVNVFFYVFLAIIILAVLGFDPLALFISISGVVLAFAFMIGAASSKYFEGILFILARRPYDIGDRISVSDVNIDASFDGSASWFVQNVDLFTTTVRFGATNEVATLANGSLASSRIINAKRSLKAVVYVSIKFSVKVPYSKVLVFKKTVEAFVRDRPREWVSLNSVRATRIVNEQGFIEYSICLVHRESWQNIGVILQSRADVSSFCLEVSKKLEMSYTAPPVPVNLSFAQPDMHLQLDASTRLAEQHPNLGLSDNASQPSAASSPDVRSIAAMFAQGEAQRK